MNIHQTLNSICARTSFLLDIETCFIANHIQDDDWKMIEGHGILSAPNAFSLSLKTKSNRSRPKCGSWNLHVKVSTSFQYNNWIRIFSKARSQHFTIHWIARTAICPRLRWHQAVGCAIHTYAKRNIPGQYLANDTPVAYALEFNTPWEHTVHLAKHAAHSRD